VANGYLRLWTEAKPPNTRRKQMQDSRKSARHRQLEAVVARGNEDNARVAGTMRTELR
jgi:hypothetical protein